MNEQTKPKGGKPGGIRWLTIAVLSLLAVTPVVTGAVMAQGSPANHRPQMPKNPDLEAKVGVQVVRATLAGDGGLLDLRYVVLDAPSAQYWFANTSKPPKLFDTRNSATISNVAPMRDAHQQRPGQTYFLIYQNAGNTIHRGDRINLSVAGVTLRGIPVE
jgi:hypothetical protein